MRIFQSLNYLSVTYQACIANCNNKIKKCFQSSLMPRRVLLYLEMKQRKWFLTSNKMWHNFVSFTVIQPYHIHITCTVHKSGEYYEMSLYTGQTFSGCSVNWDNQMVRPGCPRGNLRKSLRIFPGTQSYN